jgi:ABC-type transport system involved in multi-copper enzyme maturation permease subunit
VTNLIRAEFLKVRTTRAIFGYLIVLVLLSGTAAAAEAGSHEDFERIDPGFQRNLLSTSVAAPLIALLVGITLVTIEWRHGTITRTFLATPQRERVLAAKQAAAALVGTGLAVLGVVVVLIVAVSVFSADGVSLHVDGALVGRIVEIVLAAAIWGAIGAGVGALVQNQTAALIAAIVWVILVEQLIDVLLDLADHRGAADVLPGRALGALDGSHTDGLSPAAGGLAGLGYVALFALLAHLRIRRQDIT